MYNLFFKRINTQNLNAKVRRGVFLCPSALSLSARRFANAFLYIFLILLLFPLPSSAAQTQPERTPTLREGNLTVDLEKMVIDLRPENASFRDAFYQLMRKGLGAKPLSLDLSYTLILGDFIGSDLSLRTPLYAQAITQHRLIKSFSKSSELLTLADIL